VFIALWLVYLLPTVVGDLLARASTHEAAKKAFIDADEEDIDDEVPDEPESEPEEEAEEVPHTKRVKVERPLPKKQQEPIATSFPYGILYELNALEIHTYFVFIPRCDGLEVKLTRPEGTTSIVHLELNYSMPLAVVNDLSYETGYSIAYLQTHNPPRTFTKTIKLPFTIDKFTAKVVNDAHTIIVRIVGQDKLPELTIK
jgi:hypothetical protein